MPTVEQARETKAGPELDAMFFEVCCGWRKEMLRDPTTQDEPKWSGAWLDKERMPWTYCRPVSTDANACEAWAMRWAREQGLIWSTGNCEGEPPEHWAELERYSDEPRRLFDIIEHGTDWKEAFVRACVVAAINLQAKGT